MALSAHKLVCIVLVFVLSAVISSCSVPTQSRSSDTMTVADAVYVMGEDIRSVTDEVLLEDISRRTFDFFWETANPENGLVPDRYPSQSFASVAAVGFGLTALPIGVERGYVSREEASNRVLTTLRFFMRAPQGQGAVGMTGYKGFYYHFLDMDTGVRFNEHVELSTIDTALFLVGALFCQTYFDQQNIVETEIRTLAEALYARVDWSWASPRSPLISHGWFPEKGFIEYDWGGFNEAMPLYVLAIAAPEQAIPAISWERWAESFSDAWGHTFGKDRLLFPSLFGHQFNNGWIDFRGIKDKFIHSKNTDYFESARRAVYAQQKYATENPLNWKGYDKWVWGLSASDGPADTQQVYQGETRQFASYSARGITTVSYTGKRNWALDDGTITPMAAGASIAFAPDIVIPTLRSMRSRYGKILYSKYGFLDAFNPSFEFEVPLKHGRVIPGVGWVDTDYVAIDQGPLLMMLENYRSGLVWQVMRTNKHIINGLKLAGFTGGWLDQTE